MTRHGGRQAADDNEVVVASGHVARPFLRDVDGKWRQAALMLA